MGEGEVCALDRKLNSVSNFSLDVWACYSYQPNSFCKIFYVIGYTGKTCKLNVGTFFLGASGSNTPQIDRDNENFFT